MKKKQTQSLFHRKEITKNVHSVSVSVHNRSIRLSFDSWWRHQMETFSALLALSAGNKLLSKQWWDWWFETPSHPLWRHCIAQIGWGHSKLQWRLTLNVWGPSYPGLIRPVSLLMMPGLLASVGHQHPWYWLYNIGIFLYDKRKDFNCLCTLIVEE